MIFECGCLSLALRVCTRQCACWSMLVSLVHQHLISEIGSAYLVCLVFSLPHVVPTVPQEKPRVPINKKNSSLRKPRELQKNRDWNSPYRERGKNRGVLYSR